MIITKEKLITELAHAERQVARCNDDYQRAQGVAAAFRVMLAMVDEPEPGTETAPAAPEKPAP